MGAKIGLIAPDDTHLRLPARAAASRPGRRLGRGRWRTGARCPPTPARVFDRDERASTPPTLAPQVTWGTSPEHVIADRRPHPRPGQRRRRAPRHAAALDYMGLAARRGRSPARRSTGSSSAPAPTARLSDLRAAAAVAARPPGRAGMSRPGWCPAPRRVKREAEAEGLRPTSSATPASSGASPAARMCVAANGETVPPRRALRVDLQPQLRRPAGPGARTHLASPRDGRRRAPSPAPSPTRRTLA